MTPERIELGQGVALNLLPCDKFKTNALTIDFLCPLSSDTVAENALLPYVLKRGTRRFPTRIALAREEERLYGSSIYAHFGKIGDIQFFGFSSAPLRNDYAEGNDVTMSVLGLIAEMLRDPVLENGHLSSSYVKSEKGILSDRIKAMVNDKYAYSLHRCREEMQHGDTTPLLASGTPEQIAAVTPVRLTDRLSEVLTSCRIEVWCAGVFDRQAILETVRTLFATEVRRVSPSPTVTSFRPVLTPRRITEDQTVKQGKLCLGFGTDIRTGHPLAPAYTLFLEILATSPTSKLFVNVREAMSLCYYCSATPEFAKGTLILASGIENRDREKAEKAILAEIDACRRGKIRDNEITAAQKSIHHALHAMNDDLGSLISWYFKRSVLGITESPLAYSERVASVTLDQLQAAAQSLILDTVYFMNGTQTDEEDPDD